MLVGINLECPFGVKRCGLSKGQERSRTWREREIMTKTKYGSVQRFPEPFVTKWKDLLLDRGYYKLYEPILLPTNSVAYQLKAVKKVR